LSVLEFDNIRQKMAEHMVASMGISPHVNAIAECDLSAIERARKKAGADFEQKEGFKLTYMPYIAEAVIRALKDFPLVNSIIDDSAVPFKAITRSKINLGMAVAMENGGLIVPVIKNADGKNLVGLARDIIDLGKRARIKKLTLDEIQGGTFTISNYGVFGNIMGTMIINQPQVAIMGVGAVKKRPAVLETPDGDFVVIKPMVYLTLSFDHRLIDGAMGGKFIMRVVHYLENYSS
ncbi:MAG: 2-oxo acid dehydrogenase subunit E2, partial [Ignavibacteriae bacterium]|nr:2-oxo acid dehydrogenase subunit E2 [Ignavibacteriota bacterium]